jgi:hypothetical protein
VPAAAVIPAPIAYIKVVAVKKLVVGFRTCAARSAARRALGFARLPSEDRGCPSLGAHGVQDFYFEKIRVFKAGRCLNTLAWNNKIGLWFYFVGF